MYIIYCQLKKKEYPTLPKKYNGSEGHMNYFAIITITIISPAWHILKPSFS